MVIPSINEATTIIKTGRVEQWKVQVAGKELKYLLSRIKNQKRG
jgi:hypothetical protein